MPAAAASTSCRNSRPKAVSTPIIRSRAWSGNREASVETSLMENTVRAAMHPADEFVAMAALIDGGATIDDVTKRFGDLRAACAAAPAARQARARIARRLTAPATSASRSSPPSRSAPITQAQLAVWDQVKDQFLHPALYGERLLTESAVPLDSDLGQFVGAEAYEAAGGTITRDLFSGDEDGFLDDAAPRAPAGDREARSESRRTAPAMGLDQGRSRARIPDAAQYDRVEPRPAEVPDELAAEIERIEQRLAELEKRR